MKKAYKEAKLDVFHFEATNIIVTSETTVPDHQIED